MLSLEICKSIEDKGWPQDRGGVVSHTQNNVLYWFACPTEPQIDDAIVEALKVLNKRHEQDNVYTRWFDPVTEQWMHGIMTPDFDVWQEFSFVGENGHEQQARLLLKLLDTMTAEQRDALWAKIGRAA